MSSHLFVKNKFIALILLVSSCAAYKAIDMSNISLGITKAQTISQLGKKPDNVIGSKQYPYGNVEVLQYTVYEVTGAIRERYWLYYLKDTLKQWGRPGDWQKQADAVYELRIK